MVSRYILILTILLLITPLSAVDLSTYDGFITPKFGASVNNDYVYTSDLVQWKGAMPSYEYNGGYYNIFEDNEEVDFYIWMNTSYSGELYLILFYLNKDGLKETSDYLIYSGKSGDFMGWFNKKIEIPSNAYGDCSFRFVLSSGYWFESPNNKFSKSYSFFTKQSLNTNWKQKRILSVSSTEKLKDGITQLNLNSTLTKDVYLEYAEDNDNSYTGIITDLVFTNEDYTKVYPYFVNKYKGGYFEFNRNITNNTLIDLWINENITSKNLYMFYDYNDSFVEKYPDYLKVYNFGLTIGIDDRLNNPYIVHQVFSDWRWNE